MTPRSHPSTSVAGAVGTPQLTLDLCVGELPGKHAMHQPQPGQVT